MAFILLSAALPAHADLGAIARETVVRQIERRIPRQAPMLIFDLPEKAPTRYNLHWRIAGRLGPFTYRDDLGDGQLPRLGFSGGIGSFRQENMSRIRFEIRKDF